LHAARHVSRRRQSLQLQQSGALDRPTPRHMWAPQNKKEKRLLAIVKLKGGLQVVVQVVVAALRTESRRGHSRALALEGDIVKKDIRESNNSARKNRFQPAARDGAGLGSAFSQFIDLCRLFPGTWATGRPYWAQEVRGGSRIGPLSPTLSPFWRGEGEASAALLRMVRFP